MKGRACWTSGLSGSSKNGKVMSPENPTHLSQLTALNTLTHIHMRTLSSSTTIFVSFLFLFLPIACIPNATPKSTRLHTYTHSICRSTPTALAVIVIYLTRTHAHTDRQTWCMPYLPPSCSAAYTIYDSMYVWMDETASDSDVHERRRTGGAFGCTAHIAFCHTMQRVRRGPQHPQTDRQTWPTLLPTSEEMADGWTRWENSISTS